MRHRISPCFAAMMLSVAGAASAADIDVMTQNQYVGTDLIGLVESDDFNAAVIAALQDRAASLPTERAKALAALIHKRGPDLVGLQEVYKFTCLEMQPFATQDPEDGKGCDNQAIAGAFTDQLEDTLAALGGRYVEAATVVNLNLPDGLVLPNGSPLPLPEPLPGIPIEIDGMMIFLGVIDRDIILARSDIDYTPVPFAAAYCPTQDAGDGCNYDEQATAYADIGIAVPGAGTVPVRIYFTRGFVGIDATVSGVPYRFVTTHLETRLESVGPAARSFQSAQAFELLTVLDRFPMAPGQKLLVVGDMNSDPRDPVYPTDPGFEFLGTPPYLQFTAAGFTDAWTKQPATPKGKGAPLIDFTCCQLEDLSNVKSDLYERIDLIFSKAPIKKVPDAKLLGESMGDKTLPKSFGVWPSDHASVATRIQY